MTKFFISLVLLFSLPLLNKTQNDYNGDYPYPDDYYDDNDYNYFENFNETLKNYLIDNGLFDSDRLIEPHEMKKILYEVISEGDSEKNTEGVKKVFQQMAERFTDVYFNDKKQIRGKDIYGLININDIWDRFSSGFSPAFSLFSSSSNSSSSSTLLEIDSSFLSRAVFFLVVFLLLFL